MTDLRGHAAECIVTVGRGRGRPRGRRVVLDSIDSAAALRELLAGHRGRDAWWAPCTYRAGTVVGANGRAREVPDNYRHGATWESGCAVGVDLDMLGHARMPADVGTLVITALHDVASLGHVTPHGARAIFVFDEPTTDADTWDAASRGAAELVRRALAVAEIELVVDPSPIADRARMYWAPRASIACTHGHENCPTDRDAEIVTLREELWALETLIAAAPADRERSQESALGSRVSASPPSSGNGQAGQDITLPARVAGYAKSALEAEVHQLENAAEGTRNTTLASVAASVGQFVAAGLIDRGEADRALTEAAVACGLDTDPAVGSAGIEDTIRRQFSWAEGNLRTRWPIFIEAWLRGEWPPKISDDGRPRVVFSQPGGVVPLHTLTARALDALGERCADRLYARGGSLVRVTRERMTGDGVERGDALRIADAPEAIVCEELGRAAQWVRVVKDRKTGELFDVEDWCPPPVTKAIRGRGEWPTLRPLFGVVEAPTMRPDGSILAADGYDLMTGLFVALQRNYSSIPDSPTRAEAERAAAALLAPFAEFPFVADDDRAGLLSYMLAIAGRHAIPGPCPMMIATAPSFGAGKTLTLTAAALAMTGAMPDIMSPPGGRNSDGEAEMRKRITALLLEGARVAVVDNFADGSEVASDSLAALLTTDVWTDRRLGASEIVRVPARAVWAATGVNLSVRSDLARRCLCVAIDPEVEHPEARRFAIEDLAEYVRERHPELLVAALTLLRAHAVANRPLHGLPPLGGFGAWDRAIRSAVVWATGLDPVATMGRLQETAGDRDDLRALLERWRADVGLDAVTVAQVLDRAQPVLRDALLAVASGRHGEVDHQRLGLYLKGVAGRPVGALRLIAGGTRGGIRTWRLVERADNSPHKGD